jgi:SAM-dependent methyltransferase
MVGATNGILYKNLRGRLTSYPIPELQLPAANGARFLDIGCNWGRWCVAAARRGYHPIGIDPSLGAVLAAQRMCSELGVNVQFVVGDSRYLPFATDQFELVFSYSTLQHFSRDDVRTTLRQIARILKPGGRNMIQMANAYGIRSLYHQARRGFRAAREFDVRYWTPAELNATFERFFGSASLSVDCFFGLGIQDSDEYLLPLREKVVVHASRAAKSVSERFLPLQAFADSVYVCSVNRKPAFPSPLNQP